MKLLTTLVALLVSLGLQAQWRTAFQGTDTANYFIAGSFYSPSSGFVITDKWAGFTADSGRTFTQRNVTLGNVNYNGYPVNLTFGFTYVDVKAFNANTVLVSGHYGLEPSILLSTNGGLNWKLVYHRPIPFNTGNIFNAVRKMDFPGNGNTGWAVHGDEIITTTNGGQTWSVSLTQTDQNLFTVAFPTASIGYAAGPDVFCKTLSGGAFWSFQNVPFSIRSMSVVNSNLIFVNTTTDNIFYTTNGGSSWVQANKPSGEIDAADIVFLNDSTGYAANKQVWQTRNRGKAWELMPGSNNNHPLFYQYEKLLFLNAQQGWAFGDREKLIITTNGGGTSLPRALFEVNTSTTCTNNTVQLQNQSHDGYGYKWIRNGTQFATTYNASYTVGTGTDTIKLVVTRGALTDTMTQVVEAAGTTALQLNSRPRRDTICSDGGAVFEILNSRTDAFYQVGRPCCGSGIEVAGNGGTLTITAPVGPIEDSSSTFYVSARVSGPCGNQSATKTHRVRIINSNPVTTTFLDTVCTQFPFNIRVPNSLPGYQYWADPSFPKVNGTGGTINLPCNVSMASSSLVVDANLLLTRFFIPVYVRNVAFGCGGINKITTATVVERLTRSKFEVLGYEWQTGTNLQFSDKSVQAARYTWRFPDGGSSDTSNQMNPSNINYTTKGQKLVKLVTTTLEGCKDSATRAIDIFQSTGAITAGPVCSAPGNGNAVDSLIDNKYFIPRALYEDEYGNRIIAGGQTTMNYPRGYDGWFAAKYSKDGQRLWYINQTPGDDFSTFNQNTHIVIEQAVGDALGYTYMLGHSLNRNSVRTSSGQGPFPVSRYGAFVMKVSPQGVILWVKPMYNFNYISIIPSPEYAGGSLLRGKNNDVYVVATKQAGNYFYFGDELAFNESDTKSGVVFHLNSDGGIIRKRSFPITFYSMRRFNIYSNDSYDVIPPATWDSAGRIVVQGDLNTAQMSGNTIDAVNLSFNPTTIKSALLFLDTASFQFNAVRPIFKNGVSGAAGVSAETYAVDAAGNYYSSWTEFRSIPSSSLAYQNDTQKPSTYIAAYSAAGALNWIKQADGLQPKNMAAFSGQLRVTGTNYERSGYTNGAMNFFSNQSPTLNSVKKLTTIGDLNSFEGGGRYGQGSLDIVSARLNAATGQVENITHLGTDKEDENMRMAKGYGDQLWVASLAGSNIRNVLNITDVGSKIYTYKMPVGSDCNTSYQTLAPYVKLDLTRLARTCIDNSFTLRWSYHSVSQVNLSFSLNNGGSYTSLAGPVPATDLAYTFNAVSAGVSGLVKFRITDNTGTLLDTVSHYVNTKVVPTVSISASPALIVCNNSQVVFTAIPVNGGSSPTYEWNVTGSPILGNNTNTYTLASAYQGFNVNVRLFSNAVCATPATVLSSTVAITATPNTFPQVGISGNTMVNQGGSTLITANPVNGGSPPQYQWQDSSALNNWQNIPGATAATINYTPAATGVKLRCRMTSTAQCPLPGIVTSAALQFTVNPATGIRPDPALVQGIKAYPNPARGQITIDTLKISDRWESLEITGVDGKQKLITAGIAGKTRVTISLAKLPAGVYLAVLRNRAGKTVWIKIVKE